MKKNLYNLILITIVFSVSMRAQTIKHPWHVIDRGGGKATSGNAILQSSIGQPLVQKITYIDTGAVLEGGYIPGLRNVSGAYTTCALQIDEGWNMLSVPLNVNDYRKSSLFSTSISDAFYYYSSYQIKDTLKNSEGYWLKFPSAQTTPISGTSYMNDTIDVNKGWNMIGGVSYPILASDIAPLPPVIIQSPFYSYVSGFGYVVADTLLPGRGYWVKVSAEGKLIVHSGSFLAASSAMLASKTQRTSTNSSMDKIVVENGLNTLTFTDAKGKNKLLYFSSKQIDLELSRFELPPLPPDGVLDVRFSSGRFLEMAERQDKVEPIRISSAEYPVTIRWEMKTVSSGASLIIDNKKINMAQSSEAKITNSRSKIKLELVATSILEIPKEFALQQNYPNPFNPSTTINYQLPIDSWVRLKIYNLLGQEVATLVDGLQEAGYKSVVWNAGNFPSGIYIYRLNVEAGEKSVSFVKKLVLVK